MKQTMKQSINKRAERLKNSNYSRRAVFLTDHDGAIMLTVGQLITKRIFS